MTPHLALLPLAYLTGSIPFAFIIAKHHNIDLRSSGSHNIGATNVSRLLGPQLGLLTLLLDASKGAAPLLLALALHSPTQLLPAIALASILGHIFPIFLRFHGGKGVATTAGALLILHPSALLLALTPFLIIAATTRIISLASLSAALTLLLAPFLLDGPHDALSLFAPRTALLTTASLTILIQHRANISRLLHGRETRLGPIAESRTEPLSHALTVENRDTPAGPPAPTTQATPPSQPHESDRSDPPTNPSTPLE